MKKTKYKVLEFDEYNKLSEECMGLCLDDIRVIKSKKGALNLPILVFYKDNTPLNLVIPEKDIFRITKNYHQYFFHCINAEDKIFNIILSSGKLWDQYEKN